MKYALLLAGLGLVSGCGEKPAATTKATVKESQPAAKGEAEHDHGNGPNGGTVFDLGKYHAEFTVDHAKKECTVLMLNLIDNTPIAVIAKELTLTTKATKTENGKAVPPMTIMLKAHDEKDGKAMKFVGTDPGLGNVAEFAGTVLGEIGGKPAKGEFEEK